MGLNDFCISTVDVNFCISTVDVLQNKLLLFGWQHWQRVEHVHDGMRRDRDGLRRRRRGGLQQERLAAHAASAASLALEQNASRAYTRDG